MGHFKVEETEIHPLQMLMVHIGYALMFVASYIYDYIANTIARFRGKSHPILHREGYAPMFEKAEYFWVNYLYGRMSDCWDRPIASVPGTYIDVLERKALKEFNQQYCFTGNKMNCLNLGSYNYLGFAHNAGPAMQDFTTSNCASTVEGGYTATHKELETTIAEFVGKESAIIFEMGYATNSTTLPALVRKGALVVSDSLNHASLVMGLRASGATVKVFPHNDTAELEHVLRVSIAQGQPGTGKPFTMILIVVEGIYSMEGVICKLPEIVQIKKKYKAFLYLDEAHSIGALGPRGRGACDHYGLNPADVDILMGTFTKSFASVGGYIAGSKDVIDYLRASTFGTMYANSMSCVCAQQAIAALKIIMGRDGTDAGAKKLQQLRENSNYFRFHLQKMGFQLLGNNDSPIIPLMLYHPGKLPAFSRQMLKRGIATVVVAFPATTMPTGRARFCLSAGHTKADLDMALKEISEVGDNCGIKYFKHLKND